MKKPLPEKPKVETGVAIPTPLRRAGGMPLRYPWPEMKVTNSVLIRCEPDDKSKINAARSAAASYGKKHDMKFTTRLVDGGLRIWRSA